MKNSMISEKASYKKTAIGYIEQNKIKIAEVISSLLILLFVYTAVSKLSDHSAFEWVLGRSPLIRTMNKVIAWTLPVIELIVAVLLFFQKTRLFGLLSSLILMLIFTLYIAYMIFLTPDRPCNCGGVLQEMTWNQHLIFNIFFSLLSYLGILLLKNRMPS